MFSDDDAAALYDAQSVGPEPVSGDRYYLPLVMGADAVLDVGCGTGAMLAVVRERGHRGRLVGLDPDRAALRRARRRADVEWVEGTAADAPSSAGFSLVTMTGHAFQFLISDEDVSRSLAAMYGALRPGGRLVFETRHPQARAWEAWNPDAADDLVDGSGRALRGWHEIDTVAGDVVTFHGTVASPDGTVLRVDSETLRFLDVATLNDFLAGAGFEIEAQYGDWDRGSIAGASREIVTLARRP